MLSSIFDIVSFFRYSICGFLLSIFDTSFEAGGVKAGAGTGSVEDAGAGSVEDGVEAGAGWWCRSRSRLVVSKSVPVWVPVASGVEACAGSVEACAGSVEVELCGCSRKRVRMDVVERGLEWM